MSQRKVMLVTPLSSLSGYGIDGIGLATAFDSAGWDVHIQPSMVAVPIPPHIAALLCKEPTPPFDLSITHIDPQQMSITPGLRRASQVAIGWTMWEWLSLSNLGEPALSELPEKLKPFDALVSYDSVSQTAMNEVIPEGVKSIVQQGGYLPDDWKYVERDWHETFRYCMVAQMNPRKNPFLAVEAFGELKEEHGEEFDAELHLKSTTQYFHPTMEQAYPGLKIHYEYLTTAAMRQFYADKHVLISTSHGEGKNMPALEAQSTGMVSLCTSFGGHTVWQHPAYSLGIDYELIDIYGSRAAQPKKDDLKAKMLWLYQHRSEAASMGRLASQAIPQQCSWPNVISRLLDKLRAEGLSI